METKIIDLLKSKTTMFFGPETILMFHCGRGGRYNNGGHITFEGVVTSITDCSDYNDLFCPNGLDYGDMKDDDEFVDGGGNSTGLTKSSAESGIGIIDLDGDFDKTWTTYLKDIAIDIEDPEMKAIFESENWDVLYDILRNFGISEKEIKIADYFDDQEELVLCAPSSDNYIHHNIDILDEMPDCDYIEIENQFYVQQ